MILRRRSLIQRRRGHASAARAPLKGTEEEKEAEMKNEEVVEENVMEVEMKKEDEDVNKEEEDEVKKVKVVEEDERKKEDDMKKEEKDEVKKGRTRWWWARGAMCCLTRSLTCHRSKWWGMRRLWRHTRSARARRSW